MSDPCREAFEKEYSKKVAKDGPLFYAIDDGGLWAGWKLAWNIRSVAEVPSEDEMITVFIDEYRKRQVGNRIYHGIQAIHALLIQRQGGR